MNHWNDLSWNLPAAPQIASFSTVCNLLHYFSRDSIALDLIFTSHTPCFSFRNCVSSLQHMEPTPSQVRNDYSQKNQKKQHERALAFNKAVNYHFPSNVCCPVMCLPTSPYRWLISLIWLMKQDDVTDQNISDDARDGDSVHTGWSTLSSNIEQADFDDQQGVLCVGQVGGLTCYKAQGFHHQRNEAMPILTLHAPCFQLSDIHPGQLHHHCSNANRKPSSTNHPRLTMHYPRRCCCNPSLVETRMLHNQSPVQIRMFPNTKGHFWGSEKDQGGKSIHEDSFANIIQWQVLDGCRSLETCHSGSGLSVGIGRSSCRYTLGVSIARQSISQNRSANTTGSVGTDLSAVITWIGLGWSAAEPHALSFMCTCQLAIEWQSVSFRPRERFSTADTTQQVISPGSSLIWRTRLGFRSCGHQQHSHRGV